MEEILHHLGCISTLQIMGYLPYQLVGTDFWTINSSTCFFHAFLDMTFARRFLPPASSSWNCPKCIPSSAISGVSIWPSAAWGFSLETADSNHGFLGGCRGPRGWCKMEWKMCFELKYMSIRSFCLGFGYGWSIKHEDMTKCVMTSTSHETAISGACSDKKQASIWTFRSIILSNTHE